MSPTSKLCRQHSKIVTIFKSPTSLLPWNQPEKSLDFARVHFDPVDGHRVVLFWYVFSYQENHPNWLRDSNLLSKGFSVVVNTLKQFRYSSKNPPNSSGLIPKRWNASALSIPEKYMVTYKLKKLTWTRSPWKKYFYLKTYSKKMKIWKTKVAFFCSRF